ncbi:hypothetical protein EDF58_1011478 [Novosphingobium sp. PhB57]|uniref:hypothetical protein n=1 Tax=Novosphingobium sp. PhB57 TaxID=2485107 RepID=UPI0010479517|nr:hypothetical protein [Novosphingobium sp. PhB57]TCU62144.1 hypothetical protein EDF58_1011478 [Novosphingobium sp. PhB57]
MTLTELKAEELLAEQELMLFNFDGTHANIMSLSAIILHLRRVRQTISMVELETWKNKQSLCHGINVDEFIEFTDDDGIFIR